MIDALLSVLESFKYPVFLHGSINAAEGYPDSFFTYWNVSTTEGADYSNEPHWAVWKFYVYFYSSDRQTAETVTDQAFAALRAAGWTLEGRPHDAASTFETHTGRMLTVKKLSNYS